MLDLLCIPKEKNVIPSNGSLPKRTIAKLVTSVLPAIRKIRGTELPKSRVVSMGRRNTQLRPTFIENKS